MSIREERAEATRTQLIDAAAGLFAEHGYAGVGTEDVVRAAGLTRGALYHHFADKRALFEAVHERQEEQLVAAIGRRMAEARGDADPLVVGMRAFLDACTEPALLRIALLDAPTVLGWRRWREIDEQYGLGLIMAALEAAMASGALRRQDPRPLAHLVLAALGEAAQLIAHADDPAHARTEVEPALLSLLSGLGA
ncbi:TetR/AcrR family transcriptional regulator [Pseudonocardia eucalypti]|uniref:TetR/AcrR family transcriptional regulator n=1 Tax=Pseudonocardia eucalypti TaxID=648755 RepID=A0ABP9PQZ6_9PSEU|nr:AcrR family transcriptional regulator [Pseudonocardia eucalypti]